VTDLARVPGVADLEDHWAWFPEWTSERPLLMWYLTFEDSPQVARHAERVQASLRGIDALDLVPTRWLHLTLDAVAFVDDLTPERTADVIASARAATSGHRPPTLTLGPVTTTRTALVLRAAPHGQLERLRGRLVDSTGDRLAGTEVRLRRAFAPHVSLAYGNDWFERCSPARSVAAAWSETVQVVAPRLTLAVVTRADREYRWTARSAFPERPSHR
jgi:2'-5' RNA ligase